LHWIIQGNEPEMGAINLEQWTSIPRWFLDALQLPIRLFQHRLVARVVYKRKTEESRELIDLFCTVSEKAFKHLERFNLKAFATNCGSSGIFRFLLGFLVILFQPTMLSCSRSSSRELRLLSPSAWAGPASAPAQRSNEMHHIHTCQQIWHMNSFSWRRVTRWLLYTPQL
jgi:hypothetical protein